MNAPTDAATFVRWIDLSAHGITLHALRLPSDRVALVVAGDTAACGPALAALGFRRTRQGHVVHPEPTLKFADVRRHFPRAAVRDLPRERIVRIVPSLPPSVAPDTPATPTPVLAPDHLIHGATLLGVNRRGQLVYEDGAEHRYLAGEPDAAFGERAAVDYLRFTDDDDLPDLAAGLLRRALQEEKLGAEDLLQLSRAIAVPPGRPPVSPHALREALEAASVRHFRAAEAGLAPAAAFVAARRLADHLPPAVTRSADTLAFAQFSTPLPLAVAARALLGPLGAGRTLLEPTAGHGALLLGLPADARITAVEIDPERARRLDAVLATGPGAAGSRVIVGDVLRQPAPATPYDYILANPPFGDLQHRPEAGASTRVPFEGVSFPTRRLDHLILLETLKRRHPQGRAVYLIGADHPRDHDLATPAGGSRTLFNLLGDHYRVEAVIGLHGRLYGGQGAHWPLRLVVVGERGTGFPAIPEKTPVAGSWDELWTLVETLAPRIGPSALERVAPVVGATAIPADTAGGRPAEPGADAEPSIEDEPDEAVVYQERYVARSTLGEVSTMIPANMASAVHRALDRVEARQGCSVDEYVSRELGLDAAALTAHFAPEQIDALALAFDAHDRGRGFIEADETGIGKGRVLAGVCLRAWRQGRPAIFLTEKPNLFSDFYRDLSHIGARRDIAPLIVNLETPIKDTERGTVLVPASPANAIKKAVAGDELPAGVNLVLVTYSQLCQAGSAKVDWLCRIAQNAKSGAQVIVDESHNASGDSNTAQNVRRILEASGRPPIFSSATYAKRPDNLAVYASVLPALFRNDDIALLLRQGGAPLQEAYSQMLAEDGVLIRREHDLSNITFRTEPDAARAERNRHLSDQLASILEKMAWLGGDIETFISEQNQLLADTFGIDDAGGERKGHRAGLQVMNFGSRLYQLNRLFLLALKVDHAIEFGAGEIEAGRKPVFVLENTLETTLKEIITDRFDDHETGTGDEGSEADAASTGLTPAGEYPPMTFRDALSRVLDRMMSYTRRDRYGNSVRYPITDERLLEMVKTIKADIERYPDLPLSPLDSVRLALQARGFRVGELSGRSFQVEWVEKPDGRAMRVRPRPAENRVDTVFRFNTDVYQVLIATRSGSTGLSAHARADVPGWSPAPRVMFELQIPQNVAERIQFWGRINRRGQCAAPTVVTPSSELPGEVRLIAMQNAKLRQLSANTTSNQDNAALAKNVPDLLNPIGNRIARRWVEQNPFQGGRLDARATDERDGMPLWYINRVTSRIMLLPVSEQEAVLEELAGLYRAHLDELKAQGIQPLRTAECDWKCREVERRVFERTPASEAEADSPFFASVDYLTVEYEQAIQPMRGAQVERAVARNAAFWTPEPLLDTLARVRDARLRQAIQPIGRYPGFPTVEAGLSDPDEENPVRRTAALFDRIATFVRAVEVGSAIAWQAPRLGRSPDDEEAERECRAGVVARIHAPSRDALHLPGHYEVQVACPGEERLKTLTLHGLLKGDYRVYDDPADRARLRAAFDEAEAGTFTRRRGLLVGNLYSALQTAARDELGRAVIYTTEDGRRERGVLLDAELTFQILSNKPLALRTPEQLRRFVEDHRDVRRAVLVSADTGGRPERYKRGVDFVLVLTHGGELALIVPGAHARNGPLLHNPRWRALDIPLEGNRTALQGVIPPSAEPGALQVLGELGAWLVSSDYRDWYNRLAADTRTPDVPEASGPTDPLTASSTTPLTDPPPEPPACDEPAAQTPFARRIAAPGV
ncbi:MAG: strawberry notch family protein [Candidatus Competibacteraceae bacterium]